jgi:hypothetical protein
MRFPTAPLTSTRLKYNAPRIGRIPARHFLFLSVDNRENGFIHESSPSLTTIDRDHGTGFFSE